MGDAGDKLMTTGEVARRFGVTRRTVSSWVQSGKLRPTVRTFGGQARFRWVDVEAQADELKRLAQADEDE